MYGYGIGFSPNNRLSSNGGGGAYSYILDTYGSAKVAYSLHQLSSTATLSCRVRRSIDNAEQDIGFVSGDLDTTSLLSFVGAGNGFVVKMYDQSGNSNDASQTVGIYQRYIVQSGVLTVYGVNGKPSTLRQSIYSGLNIATPFAQTSEHTTITVFDHIGTTESLGVSGASTPYPLFIFTDESLRYYDTALLNFGTVGLGEKIMSSYRRLDSKVRMYDNGSQFGSDLTGGTLSGSNYAKIWDRANNSNQYASTTILWEHDLSADINDINTQINDYYEIY
jgi:hypothetical protein